MLMKETEDDIDRWNETPCSWIGRISIVKMSILPKAICRFNADLIKLPTALFFRSRRKKPKFVLKHRRS